MRSTGGDGGVDTVTGFVVVADDQTEGNAKSARIEWDGIENTPQKLVSTQDTIAPGMYSVLPCCPIKMEFSHCVALRVPKQVARGGIGDDFHLGQAQNTRRRPFTDARCPDPEGLHIVAKECKL